MMPAKRSGLTCRHLFKLVAVVLFVSASVEAQTGRVTVQGRVSETVALSVLPNFTHGNVDADVVSNGNTVRITVSTTNSKDPVIRVPLLVRSNSSFRISGTVEAATDLLTQLTVADVRATGTLVSPNAVNQLNVLQQFDSRGRNAANPPDLSQPLLVVTGPRVSLGGTLNSPNNALQITVLIHLRPQPVRGSLLRLTFAATAGSPIQ